MVQSQYYKSKWNSISEDGKKKILNGKISKPTVRANVHEHKEDSSTPPEKEDKSPLEASNTEIAPSNASQIVPYKMKIMTEDERKKRAALPEGNLLNLMMDEPPVPAPTKKTTMSFQEMYTSKSEASRSKPTKQELLPEERGYVSYSHELDFTCFDSSSDDEDKKPSLLPKAHHNTNQSSQCVGV